jgi:DeoR/GlpR family transcriptional regulator of sugar metabolism
MAPVSAFDLVIVDADIPTAQLEDLQSKAPKVLLAQAE